MFRLIKQAFIGLLIFGELLVSKRIKCVSLNSQPCQPIPTLVNLNSNKTLCYPFVISVNNCGAGCNIIDKLHARACLPVKVKIYEYKRI